MPLKSRIIAINYAGTERIVISEDRGEVNYVHLEESGQDAMGVSAWRRVHRWDAKPLAGGDIPLCKLFELFRHIPTFVSVKPSGTTKPRCEKFAIQISDVQAVAFEQVDPAKLGIAIKEDGNTMGLILDREDVKDLRGFLNAWLGDV